MNLHTIVVVWQQYLYKSSAGFSTLIENLRGGACNARWQFWGLDANITALWLYLPELDAVRRSKVDLKSATRRSFCANTRPHLRRRKIKSDWLIPAGYTHTHTYIYAYDLLLEIFKQKNPLHTFFLVHPHHSLRGSCLETVTDVKEMKSYVFLNDDREKLHGGIL